VASLKATFMQQSASIALIAAVQAADGAAAEVHGPEGTPASSEPEPHPTAVAASSAAVAEGEDLSDVDPGTSLTHGPVTLGTFKRLLGLLRGQQQAMAVLPAQADVGSIRVDARRLQAALLPWPERRMKELAEMLPQLAGGEGPARPVRCGGEQLAAQLQCSTA
jgi:hypothetical protein